MPHRATNTIDANTTRSVDLNPGAQVRVHVGPDGAGRLLVQDGDAGNSLGSVELRPGDRFQFGPNVLEQRISVWCSAGLITVEEAH